MIKVISAAAMIAAMSTSAFAGSAAQGTTESEPETVFTPAPSSAGLGLPLAIGGGILAAGLLLDDDDDGATTTTQAAD